MTIDGSHLHQSVADALVAFDERLTADETELGLVEARTTALETAVKALQGGPIVVPPPPPPASGRMFDLPTIVRTVQFPPSIDATGATDVTAAIKAFIEKLADGTQLLGGGPGAIYKHTGSLLGAMAGHNHLLIDWLGARLNNTALGPVGSAVDAAYQMSTFWWSWTTKPAPTHITIRGALVQAANPKPGILNGNEYAAVLHAMGGSFIELDGITAAGMWGDLATLNENVQQVWVHGSKTADTGRNNVSVVCASHVRVEDNAFGPTGYCVYDIEPEPGSIAGSDDIVIRRNSDKGINAKSPQADIWLALDGVDSGKVASAVVVDANTSTGPLTMLLGGATGKARPKGVAITGNAGSGGSITGRHIDGWVSRANTGGGKLLVPALTDCPGAVTS